MLLIGGVGQPKYEPSPTLGDNGTFNICRTLADQHQTQPILAPLPRDPPDRVLSSSVLGLSPVGHVSVKLRAYWTMKGFPPVDRQERLLAKLAEVEKIVLSA